MHFDIPTEIGAITREVRDGERDGKPTRVVVAGRTYDTTVEDLWEAITSPERIPRWLMPISGDLRLGGRYQLEGNAGGEITACDPPRHLTVTWEFGGDVTWLEVRLTEGPDGRADLELEHSAHPGDHWDTYGPGAVGIGWDLSLLGLGRYVTSGEGLDPAEVAEWSAGAEGVDFMRGSNDGWCAADVASGTPADVARPAADRTIAAYTGETEP